MSGNPYLEGYAQAPHPFGAAGEATDPELADALALINEIKKRKKKREEATLAQSTLGQAPVELTPVEKRMKAAQEKYESEIKQFGAPEPVTEIEFAKTRDPRMVQTQLDQEAKDDEERKQFWKAVESGSQEHIDAALSGTGPAWDAYRKQRAEVDAVKAQIAALDPQAEADTILRAAPVLESEYKKLDVEEKRLNGLMAKIESGVAARKAAGWQKAENTPSIYRPSTYWNAESFRTANERNLGSQGLGAILKGLQRGQRGVAGGLGTASDVLAGRPTETTNLIPFVPMFTESGQTRGELANKQYGQAMAPVFSAPAFVTRKFIEAGEATPGPGGFLPEAFGKVVDVATEVTKPEGMSDAEWEATGKAAMRAKKYAPAGAKGFFESITDPLAFLPEGYVTQGGEALLKRIAPTLEKVSAKFGVKKTAEIVRGAVKGGVVLEDPRWADAVIKMKMAGVDASAPMIEEAYKAERALQLELNKLPPELETKVKNVAPRLLETTTAEQRQFPEHLNVALQDIPAEYRAQAVAYAEAKGANAELRAQMAKERGVTIELADNKLQGYAERRFSPEYRLMMAQNPDLAKSWREYTEKLTPLEGRSAKEHTFDEVEAFLRKKTPNYKGDIWDRDHDFVAAQDWIFTADATRRKAELEEFGKIFGKDAGGNIPEGAVMGEELAAELGIRDPIASFEGRWFSKGDVEQMKRFHAHTDTPAGWRAKINRITNWVSRTVLANPASLSKDIKGQVSNFWIATGDKGIPYLDESYRAVHKIGQPDRDHAELIAAGLDRPSFEAEIHPSVIDATREFGGSKAAGAIEESGFIGAGVRGIGKGLEKIPGLRSLGAGVQKVGKGIGAVGRGLLDARQTSESVFRLATYKAAKARGLSREEALREVAKYWGDFSQLTKLESSVLKGFVLFFAWQLRSLKMSMYQILDHPFRTRLFLSLAAGNVSNDPTFPDWARRQGGSVMGRDSAGNPKFISLGAGSTFEPLGDLLNGEMSQRLRTDGLAGVPEGAAKMGLRKLAPMFQAPIEYATNYDSFSGGQIHLEPGQDTAKTRVADHAPASLYWVYQHFPKLAEALDIRPVYRAGTKDLSYVHINPKLNWLFNKVAPGIGAQLGPVNAAVDPRKDMWEAASRAFFGTPTYSVREQDLKSQVKTEARRLTELLRGSVAGTGLAVNDHGGVYFDKTSELGQQMAEDDARWHEEAKREHLNPEAYRRLKMGAKYQRQLYLIDLGNYLEGWAEALEAPFPSSPVKAGEDATAGLRRLGKKEAVADEKARRRALRRR